MLTSLVLAQTGAAIAIAGFIFIVVLIFFAIFARYIGLWIQCLMTKAGISFVQLVLMSIRKVARERSRISTDRLVDQKEAA